MKFFNPYPLVQVMKHFYLSDIECFSVSDTGILAVGGISLAKVAFTAESLAPRGHRIFASGEAARENSPFFSRRAAFFFSLRSKD